MRMKTIAAISAATLLLAGCEARKALPPGKPPQPGPPQMVTLVPSGSGANTTWKVRLNGGAEQSPDTATTRINPGDGPTKFTVNIAPNPSGIEFRTQNPLSVWAGPKSPARSGIDSQIVGPVLEQGKLVFWDLNYGAAVRLSYSIHFEGNVPSVDPIIDNGGGTWSQ